MRVAAEDVLRPDGPVDLGGGQGVGGDRHGRVGRGGRSGHRRVGRDGGGGRGGRRGLDRAGRRGDQRRRHEGGDGQPGDPADDASSSRRRAPKRALDDRPTRVIVFHGSLSSSRTRRNAGPSAGRCDCSAGEPAAERRERAKFTAPPARVRTDRRETPRSTCPARTPPRR
ncbi:hypothetical protein DBB34_17465 [Sphaerisporangium cinnabarinum]|nr:hypothetical protein DBB34_17465 [Sphaerisporangium cinnabarinum]